VKILAEEGFNPHTDIDLESLRFGAPEVVDYGSGCRIRKVIKKGKDLIIHFDGRGNGITDNNFALKLLGKTNGGNLLFGFARLQDQSGK
jgi:hypothetical protein